MPACASNFGQAPAVSSRCNRRASGCHKQPKRGASKLVGKARGRPAASHLTQSQFSELPRDGEQTTFAFRPLLPDPPRSAFSLPPSSSSAASIFQIFLEPSASRAAVARVLTEAAEVEAWSSLGRRAAARAPPRRPSAQAQTSVTAGWRRSNRSGERPRPRSKRRGRPVSPPLVPDALP